MAELSMTTRPPGDFDPDQGTARAGHAAIAPSNALRRSPLMTTDQILAITAIATPFILFMVMLATVTWLESRP
jgi:hypothetical protein